MECFEKMFRDGELKARAHLSAEDYNSLLKSAQITLGGLNFTKIISGLTMSEMTLIYCALEYPEKNDGAHIAVAEAAEKLGISVPAVSRCVRGLVQRGYAERLMIDDDRRIVRILITQAGEKIFSENIRNCIIKLDGVLSEFSDEELSSFVKLHCKFTEAMSKAITKRKKEISDA